MLIGGASEPVAVRSFWLQRKFSFLYSTLSSNRAGLFRFLGKNGNRKYGDIKANTALKLV